MLIRTPEAEPLHIGGDLRIRCVEDVRAIRLVIDAVHPCTRRMATDPGRTLEDLDSVPFVDQQPGSDGPGPTSARDCDAHQEPRPGLSGDFDAMWLAPDDSSSSNGSNQLRSNMRP